MVRASGENATGLDGVGMAGCQAGDGEVFGGVSGGVRREGRAECPNHRTMQRNPMLGLVMIGALFRYVSGADPDDFQPMKPNFGLLPPLEQRVRGKKRRYEAYAQRALDDLDAYVDETGMKQEREEA